MKREASFLCKGPVVGGTWLNRSWKNEQVAGGVGTVL